MSETAENTMVKDDGKIVCMLDGGRTHLIQKYLADFHPTVSVEDYKARFPDAPLFSPTALAMIKKHEGEKAAAVPAHTDEYVGRAYLNDIFGFGSAPAAMNSKGRPIPITTFKAPPELSAFVPDIDPNYVFDADLIKTVLMGLELGINTYLWGHMGTGKSSTFEQVCARTGRPWIRIQHTRDTEGSHITGQWTVKNGETVFELGPLAYAMKHGLLYIADEYDFAMPAVLAIYQPVLEGKPLVIKEADEANRIIRPHPNFRFGATGNTNGAGDETGLYQGTIVQNAANYERFGIVLQVNYMAEEMEKVVVAQQAGVDKDSAHKLVRFANMTREAFSRGEMALPMSPRSLINSGKLGIRFADFRRGLELAFIARLDATSRDVARETMGRVFAAS